MLRNPDPETPFGNRSNPETAARLRQLIDRGRGNRAGQLWFQ